MNFGNFDIIERLQYAIPLILSLSIHEWAHAWTAWRLGDDTARLLGRMSINPLVHIDPIGTVLLPLLGVPFGWAKPVPVNPARFRGVSPATGMMITALAGPVSNMLLCVLSGAILVVVSYVNPSLLHEGSGLLKFLGIFLSLNVILAVFNLIPIPPLDGSRIVAWLLPSRYRGEWENLCRFSPIFLMIVIFLPGQLGVNLFYWPLHTVATLIAMLMHH
jgi:Zn-dependent protease